MRLLPILLPLLSSTIDSKIPPPSDWTISECTFAIISRAREKQYKEKFFRGSFVRIIKINSQLLCRIFFFFFFSSTTTKKSERLWCQTGSFEGRRCPHFAGPLVRGGWKRGTTIPPSWKKGSRGRLYQVPFWGGVGEGKKITIKKIPTLTCRLHRTMTPPTLATNQPNPEVDYAKQRSSRPNNKLTRLRPIHSSNHFNGVTRSWRHSVCPLSCIYRWSEQALNDNANMLK